MMFDGISKPEKGANRMRKLVATGTMLVLMLAAASPAFAQHPTVVGDENVVTVEGDAVEFNAVAQNISGGFGDVEQSQFGEATAIATDDSAAVADVSQSQHFTFVQFNSALNDF